MATFSIVLRAKLEGSSRTDAEFYQPKYSSNRTFINRLKCITLGRISSVFRKGIFDIKSSTYSGSGIPFIRISNLKNGLIDDADIVYIPEEVHRKEFKTALTKGDIILSKTAYPAASVISIQECNVSQDTIAIRLSDYWKNELKAGYIVAFLNSRFGLLLLEQWFQGNIQMHLALSDAKRVPIPIFSKGFQILIDNLWWKAADLYSESKLLYFKAEQLLLSELGLQDWKPARALTFVRSYSQVAKAGRMDAEYFHPKFQEMLGKIPSHVKFDRLGRLVTYTKGIEVGSEAYTDSGIPFWRVSNLSKHGLDESNVNFISHELYESLRKNYEPQQGEILLSKDATPGIAYYLEHPIQGIISSGILRLTIVDTIPPHYLELVLNSLFVQMQIEQNAGGSIIKHWKPLEVRKVLIPRLSDDKEKEIAQLVEKSHTARREAKALLEKAKRAVEIAIEEGEDKAKGYLELSMEG